MLPIGAVLLTGIMKFKNVCQSEPVKNGRRDKVCFVSVQLTSTESTGVVACKLYIFCMHRAMEVNWENMQVCFSVCMCVRACVRACVRVCVCVLFCYPTSFSVKLKCCIALTSLSGLQGYCCLSALWATWDMII